MTAPLPQGEAAAPSVVDALPGLSAGQVARMADAQWVMLAGPTTRASRYDTIAAAVLAWDADRRAGLLRSDPEGTETEVDGCPACGHRLDHHQRSVADWGRCGAKRALYNEHLYGYGQPIIYRSCDCSWTPGPPIPARVVRDEPQA